MLRYTAENGSVWNIELDDDAWIFWVEGGTYPEDYGAADSYENAISVIEAL